MRARIRAKVTSRGTIEVAFVGFIALTAVAVVGFATNPAWAEVGTRFQKERCLTDAQKPCEKASYLHIGGAQFFGPPPPEKASTDDGMRFIHTDPHLHDGHRPYHGVNHHANIADGGALMFNWTFDK